MSKGLETWKLVRKHIDYISSLWLKEQRHIENVEGHPLNIIEKELKALEIIKKLHIFDSVEWDDYEELAKEEKEIMTQEEYELLKEVLL